MNRLKFMNQAVNIAAHNEAHTPQGAHKVIQRMGCNWVHLSYHWGFPPEIEEEDWKDFSLATQAYHRLGGKVYAYIQSSNCVYQGSFRQKTWYAHDPTHGKVYYYTGRYMTCLADETWQIHLLERIREAIRAGTDGIFFDNLWHGSMPIAFLGTWLGSAGCFCTRCQKAYQQASGESIPLELIPMDARVQHYLSWRTQQVTDLLSRMAAYAHSLRADVVISANDYDPIMRPSYVIFGQDLRALASIQDMVMIENFALPQWQPSPRSRLKNNAITIRTARALIGDHTPLSVLSYDRGIGFDGIYSLRRYLQGLAEAAACGATMTIKGTEYYHHQQHTLILPDEFLPVQEAIGNFHRWLAAHTHIYRSRENVAPVGVLFPQDQLWLYWHRLAGLFHGLCQTLLWAGLPWKVIVRKEQLSSVRALFHITPPTDELKTGLYGVHRIDVTCLSLWNLPQASWLNEAKVPRRILSATLHRLLQAYFSNRAARWTMDRLNLPALMMQSPYFDLPGEARRNQLLDALPQQIFPRLEASAPALIESWRRDQALQIHLVNYAEQPQKIRVHFGRPVEGWSISPDTLDRKENIQGESIELGIDIYKILFVTNSERSKPHHV